MEAGKTGAIRARGWYSLSAMLLVTLLVCGDALSQQGGRGGGNRMSPEQLNAAWSAQGSGASHDAGISAENTAKLIDVYKVSRTEHGKELETLMASGERGPGMFQQMQAINSAAGGAMKPKLAAFLSAEETDKVMASLGSYNREWDRLVDTVLGFKLAGESNFKALTLIANYVIESDKARAEAIAAMDFESMRAASEELKGMLDLSIASVLSDEQVASWKEQTQRRQRGGGGGRGPGGAGGAPSN